MSSTRLHFRPIAERSEKRYEPRVMQRECADVRRATGLRLPKTNGAEELMQLREFLAVGDEFGISAGAEFVKVKALPLAFHGDTLRPDAVQGRVQAVGKR